MRAIYRDSKIYEYFGEYLESKTEYEVEILQFTDSFWSGKCAVCKHGKQIEVLPVSKLELL